MSYQSGRMGIAEGIGLVFAVTMPLVFLSTPAYLVDFAGSLSWVTPLVSGLLTIVLLLLQQALLNRQAFDLLSVAEQLLGRFGFYAVALFYLFALYAVACLWTREFAENTLLTALPNITFSMIVMIYGLSVMLLVYFGIEAVARASYLILPFAIGGLCLVLGGLVPVLKPLFLFPVLGNGLASTVTPTVFLVGAGTPLVLITLLAASFQDKQTIRAAIYLGIGGVSLLRSIANGIYVASFGSLIGAENLLPFYEMARLIYLNRYVQRLEAVFILLWVMSGILGITVCLYGSLYILTRLLKLPTPKPLLFPLGLIMINIAGIPPDVGSVSELEITLFVKLLAPGFVVTTLALLVAGVKRSGKKSCDSS